MNLSLKNNRKRLKLTTLGFTLIELLAVIVILAIIALISTPIILGVIEKAKRGSIENSAFGVIDAIEKDIARKLVDDSNYEIPTIIVSTKDLEIKGSKPESVDLVLNKGLVTTGIIKYSDYSVLINDGKVIKIIENVIYKESNVNYPSLEKGMIPVVYSNDKWVKADISSEWYNYNSKKWANAVIVSEATRGKYIDAKEETEIKGADILGFFVWIPRYEYEIPSGSGARKINVKFLNGTEDSKTNNYITHPAFKYGAKNLSGIWVGKFELTGTAATPTVLPNEKSLTSQNVSLQYSTILKFNDNTKYGIAASDVHMIKNNEWGAVAYLTSSQYGRYNSDGSCIAAGCEIWINNVNTGTGTTTGTQWGPSITGCSGLSVSASVVNNLTACQSVQQQYNGEIGVNASTTGNVTGIYDMSGGVWERVMGNLHYISASSGFTIANNEIKLSDGTIVPEKNYSIYSSTNTGSNDGALAATACNNGVCLGEALSETRGWNGDYSSFVSASSPWFIRGGYAHDTAGAGAFGFVHTYGGTHTNLGSRVVFGA